MSGPLAGFRIFDLSSVIAGPLATMILADQGADVIKVENPNGGDFSRELAIRRGGFSATFLNNNRNKRSVALDLKTPDGLAALLQLLADADVIVQNFRPGVAERMGLGEAVVRKVAPEIIYVSIFGFGEAGPYAHKPVFDPLIQALSGLATVQAGSDETRPRLIRTFLPDKLTGEKAAQAITAALLSRERTGKGQHVKISMLDSIVSFLWSSDMGGYTFVGSEIAREETQSFIDLIYETSDGHISVSVMRDKDWEGLARATENLHWLDDDRFKTPELREINKNQRLELTQTALHTRPSVEWLTRLETEDVPCAPVLTRKNMIQHPQLAANGSLMEYNHPRAGTLRQARPAARFSEMPVACLNGAPTVGEHTREILQEAGYRDSEICQLVSGTL